jgi:hypothetical protein
MADITSIQEKQFTESSMTIPEGCEPIREDEYFRLPDYVLDEIEKSSRGHLPACTPEELETTMRTYFTAQAVSSNSTNDENVHAQIELQNTPSSSQ